MTQQRIDNISDNPESYIELFQPEKIGSLHVGTGMQVEISSITGDSGIMDITVACGGEISFLSATDYAYPNLGTIEFVHGITDDVPGKVIFLRSAGMYHIGNTSNHAGYIILKPGVSISLSASLENHAYNNNTDNDMIYVSLPSTLDGLMPLGESTDADQ
jgi:hypothetical protein